MKKLPTFQDQVHYMSRQAELLDEQGNDVSANVMRECMSLFIAEHARAEKLSEALRSIYRKAKGEALKIATEALRG